MYKVMNENEWNSAVNAYNSSMAGLTQTIQNLNQLDSNEKSAEEQRDWSERMMQQQNEWSLNMWNKTNEYNAPEAQIQRLRDAGLNPLYYGLDGSSAKAFESAQPLAYERANVGNMANPISVGLDSYAQMKTLENQTKLANAQVDKMQEETSGLKLDNDFKEKTLEARKEGVELANQATKEQIAKVKQDIEESKKRVAKLIEETKSEIERQGLIVAQTLLTKTQEKEIIELIPYKKNLMAAQTEAQKAAAAASYAHALYEKGLIDAGYIDKLCDDLSASIREKNSRADANAIQAGINQWKLAVKSGNAYDVDSIPWSRPTDKVAAYLCNAVFQFASSASEAIGGGLAGLF